MAHRIEVSPSGRARCRGCKSAIAKGELRFCEEFESAFSDGEAYRYWHTLCAAQRLPVQLRQAMNTYTGDIPNRPDLEAAMVAGAKKGGKDGAKLPFPHADVAPTGRARCMGCDEPLEKGKIRVVVERETEIPTGAMVRGAGYLHPRCSLGWAEEQGLDPEEFSNQVFANSMLDEAQWDELSKAFEGT
jgi:poly(ADP-ribose) polymerase-like protein